MDMFIPSGSSAPLNYSLSCFCSDPSGYPGSSWLWRKFHHVYTCVCVCLWHVCLTIGTLYAMTYPTTAGPLFPMNVWHWAAFGAAVLQIPSTLDLHTQQPSRNDCFKSHHYLPLTQWVHKHSCVTKEKQTTLQKTE